MTLIAKAKEFATEAHASIGQVRKGSGEPYITHPAGVVAILEEWGIEDEVVLAAAWLHDVPEDVYEGREKEGLMEVALRTSPAVATVVDMVTNVAVMSDGNRAVRAQIDRDHLALADDRAQTLKLADIFHNTTNIVKVSPKFAPVWLPEKIADVLVMTAAEPALRAYVINYLTRELGKVDPNANVEEALAGWEALKREKAGLCTT